MCIFVYQQQYRFAAHRKIDNLVVVWIIQTSILRVTYALWAPRVRSRAAQLILNQRRRRRWCAAADFCYCRLHARSRPAAASILALTRINWATAQLWEATNVTPQPRHVVNSPTVPQRRSNPWLYFLNSKMEFSINLNSSCLHGPVQNLKWNANSPCIIVIVTSTKFSSKPLMGQP